MGEKGFLLGVLHKIRRVFIRKEWEKGRLLGAGQDGLRDWITLVGACCADGTPIRPVLIYQGASGNVQDTWLDNFNPEEHDCCFTASPSG